MTDAAPNVDTTAGDTLSNAVSRDRDLKEKTNVSQHHNNGLTPSHTEPADVDMETETNEQLLTLTVPPVVETQPATTDGAHYDDNPFLVSETCASSTTTSNTAAKTSEINCNLDLDDDIAITDVLAIANNTNLTDTLLKSTPEADANVTDIALEDLPLTLNQANIGAHNVTEAPTNELISAPFTPTPKGGWKRVKDGKPRRLLENMSSSQIEEWLKTLGFNVLIQVFGTNACNKDTPETVAKLKAALTATLGIVDPQISTPTPPLDDSRYKPRAFLLRNLSEPIQKRMIEQYVWSTSTIAFFVYPLTFKFPTFIGTYQGFTTSDPYEVKAVFLKHLKTDRVTAMIDHYRSTHHKLSGILLSAARDAILRTVEVKVYHITEPEAHYTIPVANLYIGSPTNDIFKWLEWQAFLRNITFSSNLQGNGTVMDLWKCGGCHSDDHPSGVCPYPETEDWLTTQSKPASRTNKTPQGGYGRQRGGYDGSRGGRGYRGRGQPRGGPRYKGYGY